MRSGAVGAALRAPTHAGARVGAVRDRANRIAPEPARSFGVALRAAMGSARSRAVAIAVALLAAAAPPVAADDDRAKAVELFDEGLRELKAGHYERACAALRRSNELHPDSGTRGSLARCWEKLGKVASAWKLWVDLSSTAPERLRPDAAANAAKLEARLPKYVLVYSLANGPRIAVTIDGVAVEPTFDVEVPIDPGTYTLEVTAEGYTGWKYELTAAEGRTERIAIPSLAPVRVAAPDPQPPAERPAKLSTRRKLGFWTMGVGGALVLGGTVLGIVAKSRYDDAQDLCGGDIDACDPARLGAAQDKVDGARSMGNLATVGVVAGGVAIATGLVLFVTAPKQQRAVAIAPAVGPGEVGVVVRAGF